MAHAKGARLVMLRPVVVVALLLLVPSVGFGQKLWGGTREGMTYSQVKALYPKIYEWTREPGVPPFTRLDGVKIDGHEYATFFTFKDGRLESVKLQLLGNPHEVGALIGARLVTILSAKYGTAIKKQGWCATGNGSDAHDSCSAVWKSGRTSVELSVLDQLGFDPIVGVEYSTALAGEADKL